MPAFDIEETKVYLDSIGEVSLRALTLGDTDYLVEIVAMRDITDREFVQDILFHQLITPKNSKEEFKKISDEDLLKIVRAFIEAEQYTFMGYTGTEMTFSGFRKIVTALVEEEIRRFRKTLGISSTYIEQLTKTVKNIYIPNIDYQILDFLATYRFPETVKALNGALDIAAHVDFQHLQALTDDNIKAVELFSSYWKDYYVLNGKITTNLFATLAAQNLFPQRDFVKEIQEASQLAVKNKRVFIEHVQEISSYPEKQRSKLYKQARVKLFSIDEFEVLLQKIKKTTELRSQHMFWKARTKDELAESPERIAQGLMMSLFEMELPNQLVFTIQQPSSGSGSIDILLIFSNDYGELQKIILELKVFGEGHQLNDGIEQLAQYMENEETQHGYRVIFNATKKALDTQDKPTKNGKTIKDMIININLPNPSSLDKKNHSEK